MILVTGGAGYIGSHCILKLLEKNYEIIVFDNFSTGHKEIADKLKNLSNGKLNYMEGDLLNQNDLTSLFSNNKIDAVIHFAAFSQVGESVINPAKYYVNNVVGTLNLLNTMLQYDVKKIIFSSTAAVYGEPVSIPIDENHPKNPINPYGQTKLVIENILADYDKAYSLKSVILRYFNVAGADQLTRIGEWHNPETHLIPNILKSTFTNEKTFEIFGSDYPTKDGTCVRDYINVEDLADAHVLALEYIFKEGKSNFFNLGTNEGNTVTEIFETCKKVTKQDIPADVKPRRAGDPAVLLASNQKIKEILGWIPKHNIENSIKTAYEWEKYYHSEYHTLNH